LRRKILGFLGFDASCANHDRQGSAFNIRVKAPPCAAPAANALAQTFEPSVGARILVVDDNPVNRELVTAVLTSFGVEVTEAASARAALEATEVKPFDAILMDLRMPDIGCARGAAMIRQAWGPNQHITILAFSAEVDIADLAGAYSIFDGAVRKPLVAADLAAALLEALRFNPEPWANPQMDQADARSRLEAPHSCGGRRSGDGRPDNDAAQASRVSSVQRPQRASGHRPPDGNPSSRPDPGYQHAGARRISGAPAHAAKR
jgi:CheY-like chemotaxis protein